MGKTIYKIYYSFCRNCSLKSPRDQIDYFFLNCEQTINIPFVQTESMHYTYVLKPIANHDICWHNLNYLGINAHCEYIFLSFASYVDDSVSLSSSFHFCLYHFHPNWHLSNSAPFIHFDIALISKLFLFWEIFSLYFFILKSFWFISI